MKMSGSEKNTSDHEHKQQDLSAHTAIPPLVVQNNGKEMYKKGAARVNLFFAT